MTPELLARLDVQGPRYTSYPTVPVWSTRVGPDEQRARLQRAAAASTSPLSLYIHLPFCREMCTYCGCNVVVAKDPARADPYLDDLERELQMAAELLGPRRSFSQLHFGGGTPTFLDEPRLERLWRAIERWFRPAPGAELAVEIDPVATSLAQLELLAGFGFNRLSMGVQDFDPDVQRAVSRVQTVEETREMVQAARAMGYRGINFDLIYGLPRQTPERWRRTLEIVTELGPDRAAVYSFAYLPDLRPHQRRLAAEPMAAGIEKLALFRIAWEAFGGAGYVPIGMDHFARPEDELARAQQRRALGRNFQGYTVRAAPDTVAFGVTGISDVGGAYFQTTRPLSRWSEALRAGRFATERGLVLDDDDRRRRDVISSLMCNFWVDLGPDAPTCYAAELEDLARLESEGLVTLAGSEVAVTDLGRVFVRNVAMVFDAWLRRAPKAERRFSRTV